METRREDVSGIWKVGCYGYKKSQRVSEECQREGLERRSSRDHKAMPFIGDTSRGA